MLTKDLIAKLQALVKAHEPCLPIMGEHEVMIDCFAKTDTRGIFKYRGFSGDIEITYSDDGVYPIIGARGTFS